MDDHGRSNGPTGPTDWNAIDWCKANRLVRNLRQRIFRATRENDLDKVRSLQKLMLRLAPCLFGLYSVVVCLYSQLPRRYARERAVEWDGKQDVTFSDAITAVRRWLWVEWVFAIPGYKPVFEKLSRPFRSLLLHALAPAA